jgi:hypothetical protein
MIVPPAPSDSKTRHLDVLPPIPDDLVVAAFLLFVPCSQLLESTNLLRGTKTQLAAPGRLRHFSLWEDV